MFAQMSDSFFWLLGCQSGFDTWIHLVMLWVSSSNICHPHSVLHSSSVTGDSEHNMVSKLCGTNKKHSCSVFFLWLFRRKLVKQQLGVGKDTVSVSLCVNMCQGVLGLIASQRG